eukprot:54325-Eustigmatos_ZCMA.PRE.1
MSPPTEHAWGLGPRHCPTYPNDGTSYMSFLTFHSLRKLPPWVASKQAAKLSVAGALPLAVCAGPTQS